MMKKLGFAIKLASQGARNAIECNSDDGQWISKVVDIREYLKLFDGLQGTDNIVTFMSFDQSGCFLTLLRAISGRGGDFLSGWIYIPNTIEVTGAEVVNAWNFVGNILGESSLNECKKEIEEFFSKEYPPKREECIFSYSPSSGEMFGVRYLGHYNMTEILDVNRYQTYYSGYKAIFLLEQNGEVKIAKDEISKFQDLTTKEIFEMCILQNPSPQEVAALGKGTKIFFKDNSGEEKEFNSPVLMKKNDSIESYAKREGFEDVCLGGTIIKEDGQPFTINPNSVSWKKKIFSSMFKIYNDKREEIKDAKVFVDKRELCSQQNVLVPEQRCLNLGIVVTASGYEDYSGIVDLQSGQCEIFLSREKQSNKYQVKLSNGGSATMILESQDLLSTDDSPLKGYHLDENGVLRLSSKFVWKQRILGFLAALNAVLLIIAYIAIDAWADTHHFKFGLPPWEENTPTQTDSTESTLTGCDSTKCPVASVMEGSSDSIKAVEYLDNYKKWKKSEMQQLPYLQGLYDDMNNFELDNLLNGWKNKLSKSERFESICNAARTALNNNWNPKQGAHNPTYNKINDEIIIITNYINWLNRSPQKESDQGDGRGTQRGTSARPAQNASTSNESL